MQLWLKLSFRVITVFENVAIRKTRHMFWLLMKRFVDIIVQIGSWKQNIHSQLEEYCSNICKRATLLVFHRLLRTTKKSSLTSVKFNYYIINLLTQNFLSLYVFTKCARETVWDILPRVIDENINLSWDRDVGNIEAENVSRDDFHVQSSQSL